MLSSICLFRLFIQLNYAACLSTQVEASRQRNCVHNALGIALPVVKDLTGSDMCDPTSTMEILTLDRIF